MAVITFGTIVNSVVKYLSISNEPHTTENKKMELGQILCYAITT